MDWVAIISAAIAGAIGGGLGALVGSFFENKTIRTGAVIALAVIGAAAGKPLIESFVGPSLRGGEFDTVYAQQIDPEIKKIPALERIFRDDPAVEKRFKDRVREAYAKSGATGLLEASNGIGAEVLGDAINRYLPRARGQDLLQFARVMAEILGAMNEKDPEACILHQFGAALGKPLPSSRLTAAIGKEGQDKQLAVLNDLVLNATPAAAPFDKVKADLALTALAQRHAPLLTGTSLEVAGGKRLPKDAAEAKVACGFALALFKDLATMDPAQAELVLRNMFAAG